jgi:hypothetical protein
MAFLAIWNGSNASTDPLWITLVPRSETVARKDVQYIYIGQVPQHLLENGRYRAFVADIVRLLGHHSELVRKPEMGPAVCALLERIVQLRPKVRTRLPTTKAFRALRADLELIMHEYREDLLRLDESAETMLRILHKKFGITRTPEAIKKN